MTLLGALLIIIGLVSVFKPEKIVKFKVWSSKEIAGAKLIPTKKTLQFYQIMGIILLIGGIFMLTA